MRYDFLTRWEPAERRILAMVGVLMAVDLVFVAGFAIHRLTGWLSAWWVDIHQELAPPEIFQYIKEAAIAIVAVALWQAHRAGAYLWAAALFAWLLVDDALGLHERGGAYLATALSLKENFRLRAVDFGELIIVATLISVMLPSMLVAHWRADDGARRFMWLLYTGLASLAVVGVLGDMVGIMLIGTEFLYATVIFEDGGEMFVMSALVGLMFWQWNKSTVEQQLAKLA